MKIAYMCFVSNGFDDHFKALVCSSMSVREFLPSIVKEYWKSSSWLTDAVGPCILAVNLDTLQVRPLGLFRLDRGGKLYPQIGRGQYSGKPETPDDMRERAKKKMKE